MSSAAADQEPEAVTADLVGFLAAGTSEGSGADMVGLAFLFVFLATAGGGGGDTTGGTVEPDLSPVLEEGCVE